MAMLFVLLPETPLRTTDKEFILDFIYAVHQLKGSDALNAVRLQRLKERAIGIILFFKERISPEINIMEVHAHTHTPRKKWTHYFWEFLMLFLAVIWVSLRKISGSII